MSDRVVKCPAGTTMQQFCACYHCAVVMFNPGMLHFTSLTQDIYTSSFLGVPQRSMNENDFSDRKSFLFSFLFFFSLCPCATNTSDKPEHSSVKLILKVPYIWCCLGPSQHTGTFCVCFFCDFFSRATFSLLGVGKTSVGPSSTAFACVPGSELPSPVACSTTGNVFSLCRTFTSTVYRKPGCYQV